MDARRFVRLTNLTQITMIESAKILSMTQISLVPTVLTTPKKAHRILQVARLAIQVGDFLNLECFLILPHCLLGYYCPAQAAFDKTLICADGYYCFTHSPFQKPNSAHAAAVDYFSTTYGGYCSPGTYCPSGTSQAIDCDAGFYCPNYLMRELDTSFGCKAGFYCTGKAKTPTPKDGVTGNICPSGNYCQAKSTSPFKCPAGTYLPYTGAQDASECQYCLPGQYCGTDGLSNPSGSCSSGFYCPAGQSQSSPIEYICPMGYICPAGSKTPQLCPPGQYTTAVGSTTCVACAVGKYCSDNMFGITCDQGNYCPGNNKRIQCPIGTYSSSFGLTDITQCTNCGAGYSCENTGLKAQSTKCDTGYICTGKAITPKPTSLTNYGGRMCVPGEICPQGSSTVTSCPAGKYCKDYASGVASAECEAGYYCPGGQVSKNPQSYICPPGYFCPAGSSTFSPCPKGTYSPSQGASTISDCQPCPGGSVCDSAGIGTLSNCAEGYYCPKGASVANPIAYLCDAGYRCPAGSSYQKICLPGTYQPGRGKKECLDCPAGYYCDGREPSKAVDCPVGYYCPLGTKFSVQYPCPPGTYNPSTAKTQLSDCINIPRGYYSENWGASQYDYKIQKGTYSLQDGLKTPKQTPCPRYHYCPEGATGPIPCDNGKLTYGDGAGDATDCVPCPRGYFCQFSDYFASNPFNSVTIAAAESSSFYGKCSAGYICSGGSHTPSPSDNQVGYRCPEGHYCPAGATFQIPCPAGTYNNLAGQSVCFPCPQGKVCPDLGMTDPQDCVPGHYCPSGRIRAIPCPPGTYNSVTTGVSLSDCEACPAGYFCDVWGLTQPAGQCDPGFICVSGSTVPTPYTVIYTAANPTNGKCPPGYYCPKGALNPIACPEGTYNPNPAQASCTVCPKGQYCSGVGQLNYTGACEETYFCDEGSTTSQGTQKCDAIKDGYCPEGAVAFTTCTDGRYVGYDGKCQACPPGKRCTPGAVEGALVDCEANKFCADPGQYPYGQLCPNGTYSDAVGLKAATQCAKCPAKQFCLAGEIMDSCNAGYICQFGADSPTPYNGTGAFACPLGSYCPTGASAPTRCPVGMFTFEPGAIQQEECDFCRAGYYCEYGASQPYICPPGNYCPTGSQEPKNCSVTRYNPIEGGEDYSACLPCKGGFYCSDDALGNLFTYLDKYRCPLGSYCPPASWRPYPCRAGTFSDSSLRYPPAALADCVTCPEHYYCPLETPGRYNYSCRNGTYCPSGSSWPLLCPPGKFCYSSNDTVTGLNVITIIPCPTGFYCPIGTSKPIPCRASNGEVCREGSSFPSKTLLSSSFCKPGEYFGYGQCNPCEPGFVCQNKTNAKYPVYLSTEGGFECPAGHYCPRGSSQPTPCPVGTFRASKRAERLDQCLACSDDSYNDQPGQVSCVKCGRGSTGTPANNYASCTCLGNFRQWRKSDNQCICQSGFVEPPLTTVEGSTSTATQDCLPNVESACPSGSHYDSNERQCLSNGVCEASNLCSGQGASQGYYSETAKKCLCKNVQSSTDSYCDATCRAGALKAYLMPNGQVCLRAGSESQCYNKTVFGESLFLEGMSCSNAVQGCEIANLRNENGQMQGSYEAQPIFVKKWLETHPSYKSPYSSATSNISTNSSLRLLQTGSTASQYINSAIICSTPSNPVSFSVSREHFPVYLKDSQYNTNQNFDYGAFDLLQTKLLQANMSISTFMYSFQDEGVYVFGDYASKVTSITIVKVSQSLCSGEATKNGNIFPLTEENLEKFDISPQPLVIQALPDGLIAVPIVFIILTFVSTFVQYLWENKIEKQEYELRMKRAGRRRNFQKEDGKLDKRQYLADLYKLIKDNMDEVTRMINSHDNKDNLLKLLKDKTSLVNELGEGGKQTVDDLKDQLKTLLEQLRFPDGSTLKELLVQKELQKKLQQTLNKENQDDGQDDELDLDELDRRTESAASGASDEEDSEMLTEVVSRGLADAENPDSDNERTGKHQNNKDHHERELEVERQLKIKRDQAKRKNQFKDRICDLIDDEGDRDKLIDGFEDKMRSLDHMLKNEGQRQQDSLADKLAARRNRKKQAVAEVTAGTEEKKERIEELEEKKRLLQDQLEDILENGMRDPQLKQIAQKEKDAAIEKLERQMLEKQDLVRQEYMNRLKNAKTDKERERIVDEMQRRLQAVEEELVREKAEQERNLERILLQRQQKRVKKLAHDHEKGIEQCDSEIKELQTDIDKERARVYVENGGDVAEILDDAVKEKLSKLVGKSVLAKTTNLDLDKSDLEQLEILRVQQKIDREHALTAVEKDIEDSHDLDRIKMEEDLKAKLLASREDFNSQIAKATNEKERKKLIQDSKLMEQRLEDEINSERLRQERLLEEKRKNRQNQRKLKEIEIEQKEMAELAAKETDLLQRKYDTLMAQHSETFDSEMHSALGNLERRGNADKALLLVNQTCNDLLEKRLRLLINKQFFELEKYMGTMYNQTALERMAAKEKAKARFKLAEQEAYDTLSGEALVARLNQLKELEANENEGIDMKFKQKEKEQEVAIRERLENKFFQEKKQASDEEEKKRQELIKGILERNCGGEGNANSDELRDMAEKLLKVSQDRAKEDLDRLERDKEESMERIKLQIVADNEAEVQQLQKSIEEQMQREKELVEQRMKERRDEVMGEKKRHLEERIREMSGHLSEHQKDQIMKQFMLELDNLEKAIAIERDSQLTKMRARLIKKKIEAERLKKAEQQEKRVEQVKKQIGQYLLAQIKQSRQRAEAAAHAKDSKHAAITNKPGAKHQTTSKPSSEVNAAKRPSGSVNLGTEGGANQLSGKDQLRLLLQQWSERVKDQKTSAAIAGESPQPMIWEKGASDKIDSPKSSVSKMSKVTGLQGLRGGLNVSHMGSGNANYTMEELLRRIRRIEKLTERMSKGVFEGPGAKKH